MTANVSVKARTSPELEPASARTFVRPLGRRSRSIVLKSDLNQLRYRALFKPDVDTHSGRPNIEPEYVSDMLSVCLTAYNENASAYHLSLSALGRTADHFVHAGEPKLAQNFTICIVVDGMDHMSGTFAAYAQCLGIYQPALLDPRADYHVFDASIERRLLQYGPQELVEHMRANVSANLDSTVTNLSELASRQRVILFIKRENGGKLDSHRCYFEVICRESRPGYFLQVDVGTIPDANAVYEMWQHIHHSRNVAAVSARSHMPLPRSPVDLLGTWQYGDIATERILLWPTEVFMGYMCVLSGQLCLTRSDAVWSTTQDKCARGEAVHGPEPRSHVLQSYLRGLQRLGPFESNMFLAEDRILGLEIVFQPDSRWELDYVPEANAEIDRCETWSELLAQRRRWLCSGVACRLWMFTRILDYLKSANRGVSQKLRIFSASAFHSLYFVVQWLMPALAAMIFASLHHGASASMPARWLQHSLDLAYAGILTLQAAQLILSAFCKMTERINRFFNFSICYQTWFTLTASILLVLGNLDNAALSVLLYEFGATVFGILVLSALYAREIFNGLAKYLVTYWAARPAVAFLIMTHAALNSHDTSWGTKGLTRPHYLDDRGHGRRLSRSFTLRHFELFRWKTVMLMLSANGLLFAYASYVGWTSSFRGLQVVLALVLAQIAVAITARVASIIQSSRS